MTYCKHRPVRVHYGRRLLITLLCVAGALALFPRAAFAHPMGNFSINRYSRLSPASDGVALLYIVDLAEIPTHAERSRMDTNRDGAVSDAEAQGYLATAAATLPAQLQLTLNGEAVGWTLGEHTIRFVPGQAGLPTLRMEFNLYVPLPAGGAMAKSGDVELHYNDGNYADRLGWQEVIVAPGNAVKVLASDVPQRDLSNMLHEYPIDLLQNPPTTHSANITWRPGSALSDQQTTSTQTARVSRATTALWGSDRFAELVAIELGPWSIVLALLAAFGWGAAHALSPGHGKTIVAAYLVGARGTIAHAVFLGATTTITHTLGVFVLGLATLFASQYVLPERVYPWLSTISGLLVITIGISIGWSRLRALAHGEPHAHEHDHVHPHMHDHVHSHAHEHHHAQDHNHDHTYAHSHREHSHREHSHREHSHGGHSHSHLPPTMSDRVTWRGLLALGISGGLLPCPSALVVLLGAISLGRVAFGLVLILVFSLGLATVLTAFGLLLLRAGKLFERIPESGRYARYLAVASAAFITLAGAGITLRALIDAGVLARLA